ncbi:hypothetical protein C8R34_12126 [Nitrosomonas sp. Nm84]|uniref:Calx-beta domain-containing protein n=1 Tax=Nitrosomonas sp. Nm84 TaxID=200124 RepID=UPI000D775E0B|nr:hypothetical protein [Nitrosomonas sp. Nm84]PXW85202.1 hypothetical protein C8R34_12126 [Nitrosomonas sp. Nm84]
MLKRIKCLNWIGFVLLTMMFQSSVNAADTSQWADKVLGFSAQYSTTSWSAAQTLGPPDVTTYGDVSDAWTAATKNGTLEYVAVGYAVPVYAYGATIRETWGNGFVYRVDVKDVGGIWHKVWEGADSSLPGKPVDFFVNWNITNYLVDGVKVFVNTDHNLGTWEEIDAIQLHGLTTNTMPAVSIKAPDNVASESYLSTGVFVITRDFFPDITNPLTVTYTIKGDAINGVDYNSAAPLTGEVTIPAGKKTVGVLIKPVDDKIAENVEKVTLTLQANPDYQILSKLKSATITINSDE